MGDVRAKPDRGAVLNVRITTAASEALDKLAEAEQRTRSDMARILLSEALKRRKTP
jgi:predicted transcriptional regulator